MTDAEIRERQRAMAARMDAGETFFRTDSGVCPVCGEAFAVSPRQRARVTCNRAECSRIFRGARGISVTKARAARESKQRQRAMPEMATPERDPWFVKTLDGYEYRGGWDCGF